MIEGIEQARVKKIIIQSILTAMGVALLFLFVGEAVLRLLGITIPDFLVAGGIILFLISVGGLFTEGSFGKVAPEDVGPVPIGVPLIVGPAVLTTTMLLAREHGFAPTALALVSNIVITGVMFGSSGFIIKIVGSSGAKIVSKVANLLLASIAVMMVRKGLVSLFVGS
jgi:multiple antibiotic resistance protein